MRSYCEECGLLLKPKSLPLRFISASGKVIKIKECDDYLPECVRCGNNKSNTNI